MKTVVTFLLALFTLETINLTAADKEKQPTKDQPAKASWKISGDLEEACSCSAACPCWFESKPTQMNCGGVQALFIKKGAYGKTHLDGLAIATFGQSPDGKSMMESFGNWNFSYLYIDEKATPEQRQALQDIGMQILPIGASKKTEVRFTPITRKIEGKEHDITVGKYGSFRGHLIEGGLGGAPKITNPPGADPLHKEYEQGQNSKLTYTDAQQDWNHKGTNYMQAKFSVNSDEYSRYSAGLAQKMEAMKKEKK